MKREPKQYILTNPSQEDINSYLLLGKECDKDTITFKCSKCGKTSSSLLYAWKNHPMICFKCNMSMAIKKAPHPKATEETKAHLKEVWHNRDEKAIREKTKQTCLTKYGVTNVAQLSEVKEKIKKTSLERYGVEWSTQSQEAKDKVKKTVIEKYGAWGKRPCYEVEHNRFLQQRIRQSEKADLVWLDQDSYHDKYDENGTIYYHFKCKKCGNEFEDDFHNGIPVCRNCNPNLLSKSKSEIEIADYIKSIYSGVVLTNDRKVLNGKELDIYLPDLSLAIEYNGTYWHGYRTDSDLSIGEFKNRLEEKRLLCEKLNIRLITIDESDYHDRPEVFKRFISDAILPRRRVFARNCSIKEIDTKTARDFCEFYHVNGFRGGSFKYGLYLNDELLSVAIFAKHPKYQYECIRLVFKTGVDVIGGWAKIQKHFGKPFLHYVNLKYFRGENKTGIGYRFWIHHKMVYRNQLQGKTLSKYLDTVDSSISDFQNCLINGGIAIFDLGNDIRFYNQKV